MLNKFPKPGSLPAQSFNASANTRNSALVSVSDCPTTYETKPPLQAFFNRNGKKLV